VCGVFFFDVRGGRVALKRYGLFCAGVSLCKAGVEFNPVSGLWLVNADVERVVQVP